MELDSGLACWGEGLVEAGGEGAWVGVGVGGGGWWVGCHWCGLAAFALVVGPIVPRLAFAFSFAFALALAFLKGLVVARVPRVGSGFLPDWLREDLL